MTDAAAVEAAVTALIERVGVPDILVNNAGIQRRAPIYDKSADGHYNLISALHKSVRASHPDASLYWLARMLQGGADPHYVARRIVRMASEDIGLADPQALVVATAAKDAFDFLGSPEGELALAQVTVYLACAPKSNSTTSAITSTTSLPSRMPSTTSGCVSSGSWRTNTPSCAPPTAPPRRWELPTS